MGLLSSLSKGIVSVAKATGADKVLNFATVALNSPIQTAKAVISGKGALEKLEKESFERPLSKQITNTVINTAVAAGSILTVGTTAGRAAAATVIKAITPASTLGKVAAVPTAIVATSFVASNPKIAVEGLVNTAAGLSNVGTNLNKIAENPSVEGVKELIKENPVITGILGAAAVAAVGVGSAGVLSNIINTQAIRENTQATLQAAETSTTPITTTNPEKELKAPTFYPVGNAPTTPTLPTTKVVTNKTTRKRKSTKKINQFVNNNRVNVLINNRNATTKRYINRVALTN